LTCYSQLSPIELTNSASGLVNVARGFGDFAYKATSENLKHPSRDTLDALRPGVPLTGDLIAHLPHIATCMLDDEHTPFLTLVSDGVSVRFKDQELVDTIAHMRYNKGYDAQTIATEIVHMAGIVSGADNCTCIILFFGHALV
jgi:serine/threonine protein phosphatase PrpC